MLQTMRDRVSLVPPQPSNILAIDRPLTHRQAALRLYSRYSHPVNPRLLPISYASLRLLAAFPSSHLTWHMQSQMILYDVMPF